MASTHETRSLQPGWLRLPRRRALRVGPAGGKLEVATGCVWVTLAGVQEDFFIRVGQSLSLLPGADAVVESTGGSDTILNWRPDPVASTTTRVLLPAPRTAAA